MARLATVVAALAVASTGVVAKHVQRHAPRINYMPSVVKRQFDDIFDDVSDGIDDITIDDTIDDIFSDLDDFFTDLPSDVSDIFTNLPTDLPTLLTSVSLPSITSGGSDVDDSDDCVDFPEYSGTSPPAGSTASRTDSGGPESTGDSNSDGGDGDNAGVIPTAAVGSVLAVALGLGAILL